MGFARIWTLVDYLAFVFIASYFWSNIDCQLHAGYRIKVRTFTPVQRGLCVHIPCTFTVPSNIRLTINADAFWYRVSKEAKLTKVAYRENSEKHTNGHVHLIGNVTRGDCSYYIEDPREKEESLYAFRIDDLQTQYTYTNILPYVAITDLTDKPTMSSSRMIDGEEMTLTCTSPGRCRNIIPSITWEGTMAGTTHNIYNITYDDGSRTFHSNLTFTPRKSHNNSTISCRVTFKSNLTTVEKQTLNVEYSPFMTITIQGVTNNDTPSVIVKDGDSLTLKCSVDSNPEALITWYKEEMAVHRNISNRTVTLQLVNITQSDAGKFQCFAMNEHGVTHKRIEIIYQSTTSQFNSVLVAAVGGVILFILIAVIGASLFIFRKKKQRNIKGKLKDNSTNNADPIYCYAEFTKPCGEAPEETPGEDLPSSAGDDPVYAHPDHMQYAKIEFSKLKPKVVQEELETEYSEIKKTQCG